MKGVCLYFRYDCPVSRASEGICLFKTPICILLEALVQVLCAIMAAAFISMIPSTICLIRPYTMQGVGMRL